MRPVSVPSAYAEVKKIVAFWLTASHTSHEMHWPKDLREWGSYLAVIALVLAVPLNILPNVIAPRLLDWWRSRSVRKLNKRVSQLEARLTVLKQLGVFSEAEDLIYTANYMAHAPLLLFAYACYGGGILGAMRYWNVLPYRYVIACFLVISQGATYAAGVVVIRMRRRWRARTAFGQKKLQVRIDKLKRKLKQ
jgi:hypothetical protein